MTRRTFLLTSAGITGLTVARTHGTALASLAQGRTTGGAKAPTRAAAETRDMTAAEFHASRRFVETPFGRIALVERGSGPAGLFLHGLPLNGFQWRGALARLSDQRRCLAPDFLGLGYTETRPDQPLTPITQADMLAALLDALSISSADIVASDSGGGVAQLFAARHPARVRTLLLTNCDAHTNSPPAAMAPALEDARKGVLADALARNLADKAFARSAEGIGGVCFTKPEHPTDEAIDYYFTPLVGSPERRAQLHGYVLSFEPNPLPAIEPLLQRCAAPVRMVWGTGDQFFDVRWADWLDRTFPHSRGVRRIDGAKLFFPEEMPDLIAQEARALWAGAAPPAPPAPPRRR